MTRLPKLELLEDRIVLDGADPEVAIAGPGDVALGQQDVGYTITFDNTGTETGYAPYVELIIPASGADGEGDGPTFDSASFLGGSIESTVLTFNGDGEVEHPFLTNLDETPFIVTGGTPGDTLVVFELPYGSFSPGNPAVEIDVVIDFSDQADLGAMPEFEVLGGFALGCDPLDNPVDDPPLRGTSATVQQDPNLLTVGKSSTAPEDEAATGPSYVYQYTLSVDVAPGQTIDDFVLTDALPPEIVYLGNLSISGGTGGAATTEPTIGNQVQPGDELIVEFDSVSGSVTVTFDYFVSNDPSDRATPTNDATTGAPSTVANAVTGAGDWTPLDTDDAPATVSDSATNITAASSLAIQKSNTLLTDNNAPGASPGDVYEFTLNVQVSDYFTFGDLEVQDILGDGWIYEEDSAAFFVVEETGSIGSATSLISLENQETVSDDTPGGGETTVVWDISQALIANGQDGILEGDIARDGTSSGTQTTIQITYRAQIRDVYENTGPGLSEISQGDRLENNTTVEGNVRGNRDDGADPTLATANDLSETSSSEVQIARGQIESKTVFALNGDTNPPSDVVIAAGDEVTFAVTYRAPLAAFEDFRIEDNLPQLVFDAAGEFNPATAWITSPADRDTPPAGGTAYFGSGTSANLLGVVPTITTDGPNNGLIFDFGDFTAATPEEAVIEILFTATVEDAIFAPDLFLTNQATAFETNTFGEEISSTAIAQFDYGEPSLNITKGVVGTDATDSEAALTEAAGLTGVTVPDTSSPRFSGTVSSGTLNNAPIDVDADIENVDAGDIVTFAIVIENEGSAPNGAFNVTVADTLPAGFAIPTGGLNLSITDGAGTAIGFTDRDGNPTTDAELFAGGLLLNDDSALEGALSVFSETSGENVVVITYDLVVEDTVSPNATLTNTASIASYNAFEGNGLPFDVNGPENRVTAPLEDTATATTEEIEISKQLDNRQFDGDITGRGANEVAVGENFEFLIRVDVPEGELFETVISDSVTNGGLTLISATVETFGTNMSSDEGLTVGSSVAATGGTSWALDFGTLVNAGDNDPNNDFIEIRVLARAEDANVGSAGHVMRNVADVTFEDAGGNEFSDRDGAVVRLIEPQLTLTKDASPAVVEAGSRVQYSVEIDNPAASRDAPAFDLTLSDTLDPLLTLDTGSITLLLNGVPQTFGLGDFTLTTSVGGNPNAFEVFIERLDQSDTIEVRYEADVDLTIPAGVTIENTAGLTFDSTPEDDSGADGDDRDYGLTADAEVTAAFPELDKTLLDNTTTYAETTGGDLGIGEVVTYEFVITIPEGNLADAVLVDTLPAGMDYISSEVIRVGTGAASNITGSSLAAGASGTNTGGQETTFNFGTLTNVSDGLDDDRDEIVVRVTARVTDDVGLSSGDTLTNTGVLTFTDGNGDTATVSDDADATVVEPNVELAKGVVPAQADAGDTVTYTLTATNSGTGPAYDMRITDDVVGAEFVEDGTVSIVIRDGTGALYTPSEAPTFSFDGMGALEVIVPDLPAGHIVTITYDAQVQDTALFSSTYTNTAQIARYDSNPAGDATTPPGAPEEERTYTGPSATADVTTPDASVAKVLVSSDNPDTAGSSLNIGEEVTYELTITAPQGTAELILTDDLPPGLLAQSAEVISIGDNTTDTSTNLSAGDTDAAANITINGARDQVSFDFGEVVIVGSADAAATDTEIVVRITAVVEDLGGLDAGDTLTNTATLQVSEPGGGVLDTDTAQATATVVEPNLVADKSGPVGADPGDVVQYSISVENTGTGPAYDASITDDFADGNLNYQTGSAQVYLNNVLLVPQPSITEPAPAAADGFQVTGLTLQPGDVIRVDFDVELDALAPEAQTFTNTATVDYDSVDGAPTDADGAPRGRSDSDSDDHDLATVPRIDKVPFASQFSETDSTNGSAPFDLAIGEEVTFRYEITLPEIALDSVVITDTLPPELDFVSAQIVNVNGTGASGTFTTTPDTLNPNEITFDFGAMTNAADGSIGTDDILVFEVTARVTTAPVAGQTLTNTVDLNVDPTSGTPFATQTTTADVRVVEPDLSIDKSGPLALSPGGPAGTFTVTVTNDGVAGAEGPAYDLDISDALPTGMTLDTGSFSFTDGGGNPLTPESFAANASSFLAEFPLLDVGESIVITYQAALDAGATPLTTFENTASADFFSAPDDLVDGGGAPVARDYTPVDDSHITSTVPTLDKDATDSGLTETPENADSDTELDLAIGEAVTYTLTLTLPEIPMDAVTLTDTLPDGLTFVSAEVTGIGSEITVGGGTDLATINAGATLGTVGQVMTLTLADVDNTYVDGTITTGQDAITVEITARVTDVATNVGALPNTQLTNTAGLVVTPEGEAPLSEVTATETVEIIEPNLAVDKSGPVAVNPGDDVTYSVTLTNTGTAPAFDVIFADSFADANLSLQTGTVAIDLDGSDITSQVVVTEAGGGFSFELDDMTTGDPIAIPVGGVLTVTYTATLDANAPEAQTFLNTATINYDGLPGDPLDENGNPVDDRDYSGSDQNSVATVPFLTKTPVTSNVAETNSESGDDPFELAIGEEVTYRYELYLPEIDMDSVVFEDELDAGLEFVSFSVVSFGSDMTDLTNAPLTAPTLTLLSDQNFLLDFGDIRNNEDTVPPTIGADDIITLEVVARVTNEGAASAGDTLNNTASLEVDPTAGPPLARAEATASVAVVEPLIELEKSGPVTAEPGDTVTYTLMATNVGATGGAGPAFDLEISDALPTGLSLNFGTLSYQIDGLPVTPTSEVTSITGFSATFGTLAANSVLTVTYDVTMDSAAVPVASFQNTASLAYDSLPGDPVDGSGDPVQQDYGPVTDTHVVSTGPTLEKNTLASGFAETEDDRDNNGIPDVAIGETMTFELVLTLPDIAMDSVVLTDVLPENLSFVSGQITSVGSEITVASSSITATGQTVTVTLTDVVNTFGDNVITRAEDAVVVEIVARVNAIEANTSGTEITNTAGLVVTPEGLPPLDEVTSTATIEVIEPDVSVTKAVSDTTPDLGDTITYTFEIENADTATAPAFNTVFTDDLPPGLSFTGKVTLSDPSKATVASGSVANSSSLVINVPVLQPGETLTVTASVFVGYSTAVLEPVTNTATISAGTTPIPNDPNGRPIDASTPGGSDSATIETNPIPFVIDRDRSNPIGGIDDAQFLPILLIDPIFTGTAEPGANVTVNLYRQSGELDYVRNIVADAGGHWIAIFPRVQLNPVTDDFHEEYAGSVLFDAPTQLLDAERLDRFTGRTDARELSVGSDLLDEAYTLGLEVDRPSTLPQEAGLFNTRTFFAPAHIGEIYGVSETVTVDEIFQDIAHRTVEDLYESSADPLGVSLNRFNYEFLSGQTAVPGAQ